jgi:hypothetical protein
MNGDRSYGFKVYSGESEEARKMVMKFSILEGMG